MSLKIIVFSIVLKSDEIFKKYLTEKIIALKGIYSGGCEIIGTGSICGGVCIVYRRGEGCEEAGGGGVG